MNVFTHYKAEIRFAVILVAVVAFSLWASRFIPDDYFDGAITPILMSPSVFSRTFTSIAGQSPSEWGKI